MRVARPCLPGTGSLVNAVVVTAAGALGPIQDAFALSTAETEGVVSIAMAGAAVGAFFGGSLADQFGRKPCIAACGALFFCGSVIMATRCVCVAALHHCL